jgi:hypothetical protein
VQPLALGTDADIAQDITHDIDGRNSMGFRQVAPQLKDVGAGGGCGLGMKRHTVTHRHFDVYR